MSHNEQIALAIFLAIVLLYYCWTLTRCAHKWRHRYFVYESFTEVECRCVKCDKRKQPDHWFPELEDQVFRYIKQL